MWACIYFLLLSVLYLLFSSTDKVINGADGTTDLSVVVRLSVNFHFKSLLLFQFLFDHSEFFTRETKHIMPPCNKAKISNFKFPVRISDFFETLLPLQFLFDHSEFFTRETRHIVPSCNKSRILVVYFKNNYN